jgi:hypothetical protein
MAVKRKRPEKGSGKNMKYTVIAALALILGFMWAYDAIRAKSYTVELSHIDTTTPVADGATPVNMKIKVTRNGKPQAGHSIFILPLDGGKFFAYRAVTDETGQASFIYYPYRATALMPAKTVHIQAVDESNSTFIEVNAKLVFSLDLVKG